MAVRNGPTDGKRFKRAKPSGNHKGRHPSNGPTLNRRVGETACTPEIIDKLIALIRDGNYKQTAAACVGVTSKTFHEWLLKGGRGEEPYVKLAQAVEKAAAEATAVKVHKISKASDNHWQAAAWWLERTNPKEWGRKDAMTLSGDAQNPVTLHVIQWGPNPDDKLEF